MRLAGMLALALTAWLAVASLTGDGSAEAQTSSLSVADFDQSGLQVLALASFTAGGATTLYSSADSRWGATGSLLEGAVDLSADSKIARVMVPARNGSLLRLNDDGPLVLRAYLGESGAGADLTVWLQTDAGTTSFAANDFKTVGNSYVNFKVPATGRAILTGIGAGDRFVLALTRPAPEPVPTTTPTPVPTPTPDTRRQRRRPRQRRRQRRRPTPTPTPTPVPTPTPTPTPVPTPTPDADARANAGANARANAGANADANAGRRADRAVAEAARAARSRPRVICAGPATRPGWLRWTRRRAAGWSKPTSGTRTGSRRT